MRISKINVVVFVLFVVALLTYSHALPKRSPNDSIWQMLRNVWGKQAPDFYMYLHLSPNPKKNVMLTTNACLLHPTKTTRSAL